MSLEELRFLSEDDRKSRRKSIDEEIHSVTRSLGNDRRMDPATAKRIARLTAERRKLRMAEESSKTSDDSVDEDTLRYAF